MLILDDFHRLSTGPARDSLEWFIDHLPASFQLVLASRMDPVLPLGSAAGARGTARAARGRAAVHRGRGGGVPQRHASASSSTPPTSTLLVARTEGWPAGLYLAALSLEGKPDKHALVRAFDGTGTHVVDFLADDVLNGYEPELQTFMLRTSVLERFCPELCDEVLGHAARPPRWSRSRARTCSYPARRPAPVVPLPPPVRPDPARRARTARAGLVGELHRRAYGWHRASARPTRRSTTRSRRRRSTRPASLILETWVYYVNAGRTATVLDWLRAFPDEALERDRRVLAVKAWVSAMQGHPEEKRARRGPAARTRRARRGAAARRHGVAGVQPVAAERDLRRRRNVAAIARGRHARGGAGRPGLPLVSGRHLGARLGALLQRRARPRRARASRRRSRSARPWSSGSSPRLDRPAVDDRRPARADRDEQQRLAARGLRDGARERAAGRDRGRRGADRARPRARRARTVTRQRCPTSRRA